MGNDGIDMRKDDGTKRKSPVQLQSLEEFYADKKYPKQKDMKEYAVSLKLTYSQVRTWFAERRRKERNEKEDFSSCKKKNGGMIQPSEGSTKIFLSNSCRKSAPGQISTEVPTNLKYSDKVVSESDQSVEDMVKLSDEGRFCQRDRHQQRSCQKECKIRGQEKKFDMSRKHDILSRKNPIRLQVLFSKEYILRRVFRKDGPPLGLEFDSLPMNAFKDHMDSTNHIRSRGDSQRIPQKRKISESVHARTIPAKRYGIGKGLMTVWRATKSDGGKVPASINMINGKASWKSFKSNSFSTDTSSHVSKRLQQQKVVQKHKALQKKLQGKRKPPIKQRKIVCCKDINSKKLDRVECKLSVNDPKSSEQSDALILLVDDEELELKELQAGPDPLTCSAHIDSNGRHGCPFCKDLLSRFPPEAVKMKQPLGTRPWDSSTELVKKLFKILRFLYTHATTIEICSFTLDEFAHSFHEKDSLLLGKVHVALLKILLLDVERELSAGFIPRASKDCRFLGFLHFVRQHECDVNFWCQSLNPLTWIEILRQILVAAGFGSKQNAVRRGLSNKGRSRMTKYGLRPCTLKGELFSILSEQGSAGLKVSELAKASKIAELDLPNTMQELEQLICSTLSSDITLFEKISPSAYRLRVDPHIKGVEVSHLDTEDSGSVDDESSDGSTSSSSDDSDDYRELNSAVCERRNIKLKTRHRRADQVLSNCMEIDESYSGEAWVLGLMEGEYSNLSIEEKLDALIALIDLARAGSSFRMEEPIQPLSAIIPYKRFSGSGAKIKKSSINRYELPRPSWEKSLNVVANSSLDSLPIDSSAVVAKASNKGQPSGDKPGHAEGSATDVHPSQSVYLGSDRRYNSYWLLLGPCDGSDPGHRRIYFESSEDGHWEVIDTSQALRSLLSVLDRRGTREARLFASLEKREVFLCQAMEDYLTAEIGSRQTKRSVISELDINSGDGSSPISDIDNNSSLSESTSFPLPASGSIVLEQGRSFEEKKQKWDQMQDFDKWIWNSFYSTLNAVKYSRKPYMESLARCENCHDLYWRDEKHCKICHTTFEVDFDLEERYAIHVATCRETEDILVFPKHKVLSSQLQALKAAIYAIESGMPEAGLIGAWTKSAHKLWVNRLRRTSSLPELLQVLTDFVGAIDEDWLYENAAGVGLRSALDDVLVYFQTMPQTISAVALWMVKLDSLIAPHMKRLQSEGTTRSRPEEKRRRTCTQ